VSSHLQHRTIPLRGPSECLLHRLGVHSSSSLCQTRCCWCHTAAGSSQAAGQSVGLHKTGRSSPALGHSCHPGCLMSADHSMSHDMLYNVSQWWTW
jgi:hypothetical protein